MRRFFGGLGHPHGIAGGVEAIEGRRVGIELVAEHDDEVARHALYDSRIPAKEAPCA